MKCVDTSIEVLVESNRIALGPIQVWMRWKSLASGGWFCVNSLFAVVVKFLYVNEMCRYLY